MNAKLLTFIFATLFLVSLASADLVISNDNLADITEVAHDAGSFQITLDLTNNDTVTDLIWTVSSSQVSLNTSSIDSIGNGSTTPVTESVTLTLDYDTQQKGSLDGTINVAGDIAYTGLGDTLSFSVPIADSPKLEITSEDMIIEDNKAVVTLENTGNVDLTNVELSVSDIEATISPEGPFILTVGDAPKDLTITFSEDDLDDFDFSTSFTVTATSDEAETQTAKISYERGFCNSEKNCDEKAEYTDDDKTYEFEIKDLDFNVVEGFGPEDNEWYLFDTVEVTMNLKNTGDEDIDDVIVEWGLYNKETGDWAIDPDEEEEFDLDENEDKDVTFRFTLDADDFDEEMDDFVFVIKAYSDDKDIGEENLCVEKIEEVKVILDDDFVIASNIEMADITPCGTTVQVTAEIWNIGDSYDDDIYVLVTNEELGLYEKILIEDGIDALEDEEIEFTFDIPEDAKEKLYAIYFEILDEDEDVFETEEDEKQAITDVLLEVKGSCIVPSTIDVTAVLDTEAVAGKEFTITTTLQNTGDEEKTYQVVLANYDSWAELIDMSVDNEVTLAAGESQDIIITLKANKDVSGDREFTIQTIYKGTIEEQRVSVPVEPKTGFLTGNLSLGNFDLGDNSLIWVLGVAIAILVLLIVIVAIRLARSTDDEE